MSTAFPDALPGRPPTPNHKANFVACHNPTYIRKLQHGFWELVDGGVRSCLTARGYRGDLKHLPGQIKESSSLTTSIQLLLYHLTRVDHYQRPA